MSLLVSVDVKQHWTMLTHCSQLVPHMSTDIWGHEASPEGHLHAAPGETYCRSLRSLIVPDKKTRASSPASCPPHPPPSPPPPPSSRSSHRLCLTGWPPPPPTHSSLWRYLQTDEEAGHMGQCCEAGLHAWMPFIIFCAGTEKSRKATAVTSGLISVEMLVHAVYNNGSWTWNCEAVQMPPTVMFARITGEKEDRGTEKTYFCIVFLLTRRLWGHGQFFFWGGVDQQQVLACCQAHWLRAFKNAFKVGSVNYKCCFLLSGSLCQ